MAELQNTLTGRRHTHRPPTHAQAADADADAAARIAISGGPSTTSTAQPPQWNARQAAVLRGDEQEEEEADEKMLEAGVGDSRGEVYV